LLVPLGLGARARCGPGIAVNRENQPNGQRSRPDRRAFARAILRRVAPVDVPHPVQPVLRVPSMDVGAPRFRVTDAHTHMRDGFGGAWRRSSADAVVEAMDRAGVERIVAVDGGHGATLQSQIRRFETHPDRFAVLANIEYGTLSRDDDFGTIEAERLGASVRAGARGLKIWKTLGLEIRDRRGALIGLDDERLDPLWQAAADLGVPVLIHVADPPAFFAPLNPENERWSELQRHRDWHRYPSRARGDRFSTRPPSFEELQDQLVALLARHRSTTFIAAHMASSAHDLGRLSELLCAHPNLFVDTAACLNELGRQPYTARDFLIRHQRRVLFGTDVGPDVESCRIYYRFLETRAEYVPYSTTPFPVQGNWRIYGIDLPEEVLAAIYRENADRLIGFGA
jgi:predicted TIM-barrel fold metal-dependent hydrolase